MKKITSLITIAFLLFSCGGNKQITYSPLENWEMKQNQTVFELSKVYKDEFVALGMGSGTTLDEAIETAKLEAEFQLPEKVSLYMETVSIITNQSSMTNKSEAKINIRDINYETIGQFQSDGKQYAAVIARKNKKEFFGDHMYYLNLLVKSDNEFIADALQQSNDNQQQCNTAAFGIKEAKWEEEQYLKEQELKAKGNLSSVAIGCGPSEEIAREKAKMYAALLLPEKVSVYAQAVSRVYSRTSNLGDGDISYTDYQQTSTVAKNIFSINYLELSKLQYNNTWYVAMAATKSQKEFLDDYSKSLDIEINNKEDFAKKVEERYNRVLK